MAATNARGSFEGFKNAPGVLRGVQERPRGSSGGSEELLRSPRLKLAATNAPGVLRGVQERPRGPSRSLGGVVRGIAEVDETKIVAVAATNAPGVLGVVQGVHREAILHC